MEELIDKVLSGDKNAYSELIRMVSSELYNIASIQLNYKQEDIHDAMQETIFKAYKNIHKLESKNYFKTWIIKILINECNNIYRVKKQQFNLFKKIICFKEIKNLDNVIEKIDNNLDFKLALDILSKDEKTILLLYYKYEYSTGEIANILNENVNTMKSRLLRARKKLAEKLGGETYETR